MEKKPQIIVNFENPQILNKDQWSELQVGLEKFEAFLKDCLVGQKPGITVSNFTINGKLNDKNI
jgi:hypothetical protein